MCDRRPLIPEAAKLLADLAIAVEALPSRDPLELLGERVLERLQRPGVNPAWRPRMTVTRDLASRPQVRILLGRGLDTFLYVTSEARIRISGNVPPRWYPALAAILRDEMGLLDVTSNRGGLVPDSKPVKGSWGRR